MNKFFLKKLRGKNKIIFKNNMKANKHLQLFFFSTSFIISVHRFYEKNIILLLI